MTTKEPPGFDYPGNRNGAGLLMHYYEKDGKSACGKYHIDPQLDPVYLSGREFYSIEEILASHYEGSCCMSCIRTMRHRWKANFDCWALWHKLEDLKEAGST